MGGCRCIFRKCPVATERNPGMHFFRFPRIEKDKQRFLQWVKYSGAENILRMPPAQQRNRVVCGRHFFEHQFMNYIHDRLVAHAVPKITRLSKELALDYSENLDEPKLIQLPEVTAKHLIPPKDYTCPLRFNALDEKMCAQIINQHKKNDQVESDNEESAEKATLIGADIVIEDAFIENIVNDGDEASLEEVNQLVNIPIHDSNTVASDDSFTVVEIVDTEDMQINSAEIQNLREELRMEKRAHKISKKRLHKRIIKSELNERKMEKRLVATEAELKLSQTEVQDIRSNINKSIVEKEQMRLEIRNEFLNKLDKLKLEHNALQTKYEALQHKYNELEKSKQQQQEVSSSISAVTQQQPQLTKLQLFNGIKKYLSQTLVALLRIQLASGSMERDYKPDERRVALDLLNLGEKVYKYFTDEWLIRLPSLNQVRIWRDRSITIDDDEDL